MIAMNYHTNHSHDAHEMIFSWRVDLDGARRFLGVRPCWRANLKSFLWWGPRNPQTGKLLPPGTWAY